MAITPVDTDAPAIAPGHMEQRTLSKSPRLSICICTYNRSALLKRTLESLAAQSVLDWSRIEVLVVDNNSTDATPEVVADAASKLPLRFLTERQQGLSHARNSAAAAAVGEWIVFTDDDVLLQPGWIQAYLEAISAHPAAKFAGGRITPYWNGPQPAWFRWKHLDGIDGVLGWYDLGSEIRLMSETDPEPFGASLALRRALIDEVGNFRTDLGAIANGGRGEDTEFIRRARAAGASGIYVGAAHCKHLNDPHRFTLPALYRHGVFKGIAHRSIVDPGATGSKSKALLFLLRGFRQLLLGRGDRFRQCVINAGVQMGLALSARASSAEAEQVDAN